MGAGQVRRDQVQDLTQESGGPSKCNGKVCCYGPSADQDETGHDYYPMGTWPQRCIEPVGHQPPMEEALEWFWRSVQPKRCISGKLCKNCFVEIDSRTGLTAAGNA